MNEVQRLEMIKKSRDLAEAGAFTQEDFEIIKRRVIREKPMFFQSSLGVIKKAKEMLDDGAIDSKEYDVVKYQFLSDKAVVDLNEILKYKDLLDHRLITDEEYAFLKAKLLSDPKFELDYEMLNTIREELKARTLVGEEYKYLRALILSGSRVKVNFEALKSIQNAYETGTLNEFECKSLRHAVVKNRTVPRAGLLDRIADYKTFLEQGIITDSEYETIRQRLLQNMTLPPLTEIEKLKSYKQLLDQGAINQSEYDEQKKAVLPESPKTSYDFSCDELKISKKALTVDNVVSLPANYESLTSAQPEDDKKRLESKGKRKLPLKIIIPCGVAVVLLIACAGLFLFKGSPDDGTIVGKKYVDGNGNFIIFDSEEYCIRSIEEEPYSTAYTIVSDPQDGKPYVEVEGWAYKEKFYINETNNGGTPTVLEYDFEPDWTFELDDKNTGYQAIIINDTKYQKLIDEPVNGEDIIIHGKVFQDLGEGYYFVTSNGEDKNIFHVYAPGGNINENDMCTIKGKMNDVYTYTNNNDESRTVPSMVAEKVNNKNVVTNDDAGNTTPSSNNNSSTSSEMKLPGGLEWGDSKEVAKRKLEKIGTFDQDRGSSIWVKDITLYNGLTGSFTCAFEDGKDKLEWIIYDGFNVPKKDVDQKMYKELVDSLSKEYGKGTETKDGDDRFMVWKNDQTVVKLYFYVGSNPMIEYTSNVDLY